MVTCSRSWCSLTGFPGTAKPTQACPRSPLRSPARAGTAPGFSDCATKQRRRHAGEEGSAAFCLLVSISRLADDIEAHAIPTELKKSLHNWMLFGLRPSSRVDRQYEQFALSDEGCEGVQQLHPCR